MATSYNKTARLGTAIDYGISGPSQNFGFDVCAVFAEVLLPTGATAVAIGDVLVPDLNAGTAPTVGQEAVLDVWSVDLTPGTADLTGWGPRGVALTPGVADGRVAVQLQGAVDASVVTLLVAGAAGASLTQTANGSFALTATAGEAIHGYLLEATSTSTTAIHKIMLFNLPVGLAP